VALPGAFCFVFFHDVSAILFLFVVLCSVSGFPSVLVTVFRHQWGRVVSPHSQFGLHACVCVVHVSPVRCCHSPVCLVLCLCLNTHVFHIVRYWVIRGIHQHVIWILVTLLCSVIVPRVQVYFSNVWLFLCASWLSCLFNDWRHVYCCLCPLWAVIW